GVALAILVPTAIYRYNAWRLDSELDEVIAELDRTDPRWRLEDIEKNRKVIADAENGAVIVAAAARQIPGDWAKDPLWEELVRYPLATRLPDDRLKEADTLLKCAEPAIGEAYKLRDRPFGRYPLKYSDDFLDTKVPHLQPLREVLSALEKEALLHAFGADA